jgi:hypothetical protein
VIKAVSSGIIFVNVRFVINPRIVGGLPMIILSLTLSLDVPTLKKPVLLFVSPDDPFTLFSPKALRASAHQRTNSITKNATIIRHLILSVKVRQ